MKTLKQWFSKIRIFIINILKGLMDYMDIKSEAMAEVEKEKIEATKEILMAVGSSTMAIGSSVKNAIKIPFKNKKNMKIAGVIMIGVGGSFIIASYIM